MLIFLILLVLHPTAEAQTTREFYSRSLEINRTGMVFLGGWAVANMAVGTWGWIRYDHDIGYFHQMNAAWNLVNAGIATYALITIHRADLSELSDHEMMRRHRRDEKLFLINAGLDLVYITGGILMWNAAERSNTNENWLKGYGQSLIIQGAFLFVFDLTKFGIQYHRRQNFLQDARLGLSPRGITLFLSI